MSELYQYPEYYEIAFSFRDLAREVDTMQEAIQWFSGVPVERVLEVACGNAPHMAEWARRGCRYAGIDISQAMLDFARRKAARLGDRVELIQADMTDFALAEPVDFAYVMLGSLYVQNTEQLRAHLKCMAGAVRPGGLYFLDWCIEFDPFTSHANVWEEERAGVRVRLTYLANLVDRLEQTLEEHITLEADDHGAQHTIQQVAHKRAIYPQEFLILLECLGDFEFVGWWNDWDLSIPVDGRDTINRPITVIRRKGGPDPSERG